MTKVVVIGCGVVGATIAYELSRIPRLEITVLEENLPASGSTGAALGVLMGAIAQKFKGRLWKMREISMKRYETLIPELEALTNMQIPFNRQGILKLVFGDDDLEKWSKTIAIRKSQGWELSFYNRLQLQINCPHIEDRRVMGAIYSPQDRQINPIALTQALIAGA
jgi:glycine/D-amino acid oxidase-like deaminating enzyme